MRLRKVRGSRASSNSAIPRPHANLGPLFTLTGRFIVGAMAADCCGSTASGRGRAATAAAAATILFDGRR